MKNLEFRIRKIEKIQVGIYAMLRQSIGLPIESTLQSVKEAEYEVQQEMEEEKPTNCVDCAYYSVDNNGEEYCAVVGRPNCGHYEEQL